jgi:hypothetical protein
MDLSYCYTWLHHSLTMLGDGSSIKVGLPPPQRMEPSYRPGSEAGWAGLVIIVDVTADATAPSSTST